MLKRRVATEMQSHRSELKPNITKKTICKYAEQNYTHCFGLQSVTGNELLQKKMK